MIRNESGIAVQFITKQELNMKKILFVCLGNICRSSSAEEIMRTYIRKAGLEQELEVDSAGILSYHQGELLMSGCGRMPSVVVIT